MDENNNGFIMIDPEEPEKKEEETIEETVYEETDPVQEEPEAENFEFVQSYTTDEEKAKHMNPPEPKQRKVKVKEKKSGGIGKKILAVILCIILAGGSGFGGAALYGHFYGHGSGTGNSISRTEGYTLEEATGSKQTVAEIAQANADAVVEIVTESVQTDSWFGQYVTEGAGSGVIIDSDEGYIITNNHVIEGASSVTVTLHNGEEYEAEVIGTDSSNDIGVIKIKAKNLTAATYGNSDQLVVGEIAVAIGNPLGELGGTVTSGVISSTGREVTVDKQKMTLLQTDASINPGNSGGGLFNQYGQLIGIVCAKSSGSDVEGLGFAIPINTAAEVAQQIIKSGGDVSVGTTGDAVIGVNVVNVDSKEAAEKYGVEKKGVYITGITSRNAQEAGFQIGDRFVKFEGKKVSNYDDLSSALSKHKSGDEVKVEVERNGKKVELKTVLVKTSDVQKQEDNSDQDNYGSFPFWNEP